MENPEIAAAVVGITEIAKKLGLSAKYCPVFAILIGATLSVFREITHGNTPVGMFGFFSIYFWAAIQGVIIGTTATGLYAAAGSVVDKVTKKQDGSKISDPIAVKVSTDENSLQETH